MSPPPRPTPPPLSETTSPSATGPQTPSPLSRAQSATQQSPGRTRSHKGHRSQRLHQSRLAESPSAPGRGGPHALHRLDHDRPASPGRSGRRPRQQNSVAPSPPGSVASAAPSSRFSSPRSPPRLPLSSALSHSAASPLQRTLSSGPPSHPSLSHQSSVISAATFYPPQHNPQPLFHHSSAASSASGGRAPPAAVSQQPSFLLPTKTLLLGEANAAMQQGVDENIYHWKVLNLSRAKLKASSRTSALLSGFAMVAMVEIQIDQEVPEPLLITFVVCTVLLIAVHMLALMISTCILPNVEAVANLHYQTQKTVFESPHMKMNVIVELAWAFSTVLGILLFLVEICILCWVKFYPLTHTAAWVATGLLIPILVIFIAFAALFYLRLVSHKSEVYEDGIKELQLLKDQLEDNDEAAAPAANNAAGSPASSRRVVQIV